MLKTCINFADQHHLSFNADKTQLIKFYKSPNPVSASPRFIFLGQTLSLSNSISHRGHILTYNLSDDDDICAISKDMCRKANCLLHTFSCCDPFVKTRLFSSFCLYMVLPFGDLHHHNLEPLMCHLIISCVRFGLSLAIATLVLSTLSQDLRVSTTLLLSAPEVYLCLLEDPNVL